MQAYDIIVREKTGSRREPRARLAERDEEKFNLTLSYAWRCGETPRRNLVNFSRAKRTRTQIHTQIHTVRDGRDGSVLGVLWVESGWPTPFTPNAHIALECFEPVAFVSLWSYVFFSLDIISIVSFAHRDRIELEIPGNNDYTCINMISMNFGLKSSCLVIHNLFLH